MLISVVAVSCSSQGEPSATAEPVSLEDRYPHLVEELGESLAQDLVSQFEGTNLDFILDTARMVVHESGAKEIVWDEPAGTRPGVEQALRMTAEANEKNDSSLLPLCSQAYWDYLIENKPPFGQKTCTSVPDSLFLGPPSGPGR